MLGLRFCVKAFSSCGKRGPLFIAVRGPLTITASLVAEHRLQTRRLSNCGSRAQLLCGMWDPPRPGLEPVSPALAGGLLTTASPGKSPQTNFKYKTIQGASLVAQWLRICLLMQGTRVQALVWEDPTCRTAARPVSHNYWACASGACAPQQERPR